MDKRTLARKVIATVQDDDLDMHNKFLPRPLLEEMDDASSGASEIMPKRTLRERQYQQTPLLIRPDYGKNFLERLKQPFEGKPVMDDVMASDEENLEDFSMPSEMLKHQEKTHPRVLTDDFIEYSRPGEGVGKEDLKDYWDRGWDDTDSPEMSEDKWNRMWTIPGEYNRMAKNVIASSLSEDAMAGRVIAGFLLNRAPQASGGIRLAKLMDDLTTSKLHGTKELDVKGVKIVRQRNYPGLGRYTFYTTSDGPPSPGYRKPYTTTFEFIPNGNITDTNELNVRVSCTCPSWLFYGAQYHAYMEKYLYGPVQPMFAFPKVRDPKGSFLACKHVLACIEHIKEARLGQGYKIRKMAPEVKERIQTKQIKMPEYLKPIAKKPEVQKVMKEWDSATSTERENIMEKMTNPDDVAFMAFKYPSTAITYAADRLRSLANAAILANDKSALKEIKEDLKEINDANHVTDIVVSQDIKVPSELIKFDTDRQMKLSIKNMDKKDDLQKELFIKDQTDPDALAYLAFKFYLDLKIPKLAIDALRKMSENPKSSEEEKGKATDWIKRVIGGVKV